MEHTTLGKKDIEIYSRGLLTLNTTPISKIFQYASPWYFIYKQYASFYINSKYKNVFKFDENIEILSYNIFSLHL